MDQRKERIESAFATKQVVYDDGPPTPIAEVEWGQVGSQKVDTELFFFSKPPGGYASEFPTHFNKLSGRISHGETNFTNTIKRRVKIFKKQYKLVRYQKGDEFLFHATIIQPRKTPALDTGTKMLEIVQQFKIGYAPSFLDVWPTTFEVDPGKSDQINVTGTGLYASTGYLRQANFDPSCSSPTNSITLTTFNTGNETKIIAQFTQPPNIALSYYLHLLIRDKFYVHPQPINFIDNNPTKVLVAQAISGPSNGSGSFTMEEAEAELFDSYFCAKTLTQALELGCTHSLASLSAPYDTYLPDDSESSAENLLKRAIASGNLHTILYVWVWIEVDSGNFPDSSLIKLRDYVISTKNLRLLDMFTAIAGDTETPNQVDSVLDKILHTTKKLSPITLPTNTAISISAYPIIDQTLESFLTNPTTPQELIDTLTCVLYMHPVVQPISGHSVSEVVCLQKPDFDFFANQHYGAKNHIHNKALQQSLDKYIESECNNALSELPSAKAIEKCLTILDLTRDRSDMSAIILPMQRKFVDSFWDRKNLRIFLQHVPKLPTNLRDSLRRSITSFEFDTENFVSAVLSPGSTVVKGFVFLFPEIGEVYHKLNLRTLFMDEKTHEAATKIVVKFIECTSVNLFATLFLEENKVAWKVLLKSAVFLQQHEFKLMVSTLPLGDELREILACDIPPVQLVLHAKQLYNDLAAQKKINSLQNENTTLRNECKSLSSKLENHAQIISDLQSEIAKLNEKLGEAQIATGNH